MGEDQRIRGVAAARREGGDALVEHGLGAEHAVDELGRQAHVARIELRAALELGVERGRGERVLREDAEQDGGGDFTGGAHDYNVQSTSSFSWL